MTRRTASKIFGAPTFAILAALLLFANPARAGDLCGGVKQTSTVAINVAAASTVQLIAPNGNAAISVCSIWFSATGATTNSTIQFIAGTGATCGTGTVNLTGAFQTIATATAPSIFSIEGGASTVLSLPAGAGLCVIVGGTTPSVTGSLAFAASNP